MKIQQYDVDAFTEKVFGGNQAAVCLPGEPLSAGLMQAIARENNFSETAFAVKREDGSYSLRWFTPGGEISLCGHATLAASYVLFRFREPDARRIVFRTKSGDLFVSQKDGFIEMDFPACGAKEIPVTPEMGEAMGAAPERAFIDRDLLLVYGDADTVKGLAPDFEKVSALPGLGAGVTAPGTGGFDCVSRFFCPKLKVNEDPVTGSAHCMIGPYWAARLGKTELRAFQASERGGEMRLEIRGERVVIAGKAVLFAVSELTV